jgi:exosome complex component RRP4
MSLLIEKRQLVTPGEKLAEGEYSAGENTYREGDGIFSQLLGLANLEGKHISVVPLTGGYTPHVKDLVIGKVIDMNMGWFVDINATSDAVLSVADMTGKSFGPRLGSLSKILDIGDIVIAEVAAFDRTRNPLITVQGSGLGKIKKGLVIDVAPAKIPRLIGRKGSMITMLKRESKCEIVVGQNGRVLIDGSDPNMVDLVIKVIKMVEEQAHTSGLTDRVKTFIETQKAVMDNERNRKEEAN